MPPDLTDDRIHVWLVNLSQDRGKVSELSRYLSVSELERARKFINPLHRDRWIVARGYLRQILSNYLGISPQQIEFDYTDLGKPYLSGSQIEFNLSHSEGLAVYGISNKYAIGIDIEYTRSLPFIDLVNRFFSSTEQAIFQALPPTLHQAAFFHAWTQKEAYLKACGTGLYTPLDRIEVAIDPRTPPHILTQPEESHPQTDWQIERLCVPPDYAGAIAVAGGGVTIEYQQVEGLGNKE